MKERNTLLFSGEAIEMLCCYCTVFKSEYPKKKGAIAAALTVAPRHGSGKQDYSWYR